MSPISTRYDLGFEYAAQDIAITLHAMDSFRRNYRAIMFDVDGTLVRHHPLAVPTPRVCVAVKRAQEAGFLVSVATGRIMEGFERIHEVLHFNAPVVLEGGARLYDPAAKKDIWTGNLAEEEARSIILDWHRRGLPFGFHANGMMYNSLPLIEMKMKDAGIMRAGEKEWGRDRLRGSIELTEEMLKEIDYAKVTHIIAYPLKSAVAEELRKSLHQYSSLGASVNTTHYDDGCCIYVTHAQATKQHGIVEFAKHLDIAPREIIGVGDQELDYPLLMACGLKVAMGNAVRELKDIADYIAPSVEEDGAADVIERFLLKNKE